MSIVLYFLLGFTVFQYHRLSLLSVPVLLSGLVAIDLVTNDEQPLYLMILSGCILLLVCNVILFAKQVQQQKVDVEKIGAMLAGCALAGVISGQVIGLLNYDIVIICALASLQSVFFLATVLIKPDSSGFFDRFEKTLLGSLIVNAAFAIMLSDRTLIARPQLKKYDQADYLRSLFLFLGICVGLVILPQSTDYSSDLTLYFPVLTLIGGALLSSWVKLKLKSATDRFVMDLSAVLFVFSMVLKVFI
ncbi:hypothetical protein [Marinomonas balearica]|uniref:Uncharacterized protein n=1 Tax=Marinomonas balearica TaxID=491947 RepID=A0A4R6M6P5_9GAMM|nr:hypothetical protein [Marinomonas balearica]TDO96776.1 hypothetical protein DFP79_2544 [Marinomonas balearica]